MAAQRSSNLNRTEWNKKCREKLSNHIYNRLGIVIEPSQVRLKPGPDDVYAWKRLANKDYLFSRNISDQSVRTLRELHREIGISIEAVGKDTICERIAGSAAVTVHCPKGESSFSSIIDELQNSLTMQANEIKAWQKQATVEADRRQQAELKIDELQIILERSQEGRKTLEVDLREWKSRARQAQSENSKYDLTLKRILTCINELKPESNQDE